MRKLRFLLPAILILIAALTYQIVSADGETPVTDDQINEVASQLYCPVCENVPLDVCPTTACAQWRDLIGEKVALGWDTEQIKAYFVNQYGDRVLAEPPRHGINWLVYILPPLLILACGIFLVSFIHRLRKPAQAKFSPLEKPAAADPYYAEIESELKHRKGSS